MSHPPSQPQPSALRAVDELTSSICAVKDSAAWALNDAELLDGFAALEAAQRRLDAVRLTWLSDIEHRDAARANGATSTGAWLVDATAASPGRAFSQVRLAAALSAAARGAGRHADLRRAG